MARKISGSAKIKDAWKRIARWYKVNVPADQFSLADGASAEAIAVAEAQLGLSFPQDLVASYHLHNGSNDCAVFLYGYAYLSLSELVQQWGFWQKIIQDGGLGGVEPNCPEAIKRIWWNLKWIPFSHNGGGDHHCVDLDPAEGGAVGQVIQFNHEVGAHSLLGPDFGTFLRTYATDLEAGRYRFDETDLWVIDRIE
ncbi:SMI1/KNR4 family protein [Gemmata sp. SH-PL17]|uniref:SMI1/KNR4 family protein n=1 Tax=Gemmata sp. SH-PL17 TaxID=1630693 RepID=UPI0013901057|nr:SMI1/KNR4 family protein [Gemmata sp. SH-PL17]